MGIVEEYLKPSDSSTAAPVMGSGLIEQYLNTPAEAHEAAKAISIRPVAPPISGDGSPLPQPVTTVQGGENPRDFAISDGINNYIPSIGNAIGNNFKGSWENFSGGLKDIFANGEVKSGAGRMAVGALQGAGAIPSGIVNEGLGKPLTEVTGNPDFGDKAAFLAGTAIPVVPGAATLSKLRPSNVALKELVSKITSNGREPQNLVNTIKEMKANPLIGPIDTSPAVLNMGQKLFTTEGDAAKNYIHGASKDRMAQVGGVINKAYDDIAGIPVDAVQKLKQLSDASKKVGSEKINPAVAAAGPVDITKTLENIDGILKPGVLSKISGQSSLPLSKVKEELSNIRDYLANNKEVRTSAADLHGFQAGLRRTAESLLNSADGGSRELGHSLMNVRNDLVSDIDKAANGKYKPALSSYRDEKHIAEAFHDAYNGILTNSKKLENRPEFTKEWYDGLTAHEKEAAKEGVRLRIDTEIGVAHNGSLAGTNLVKSEFNKQKMELLFGKQEADKLLQKVEHVRAIKNTDNKLIEGSQTEMRRAGDEAVALPEKPNKNPLQKYVFPAMATAAEAGNNYLGGGATAGLGLLLTGAVAGGAKVASVATHKAATALAKERNLQLAKISLPTEGASRDALIKALEAHIPSPKKSMLTRGASLARLVGP